ncbi:hypothetical protein BMASAVP1_A0568 [Burkholderia mallei SAVP1]|nr:hypothetical protein BMASAVP1_A0568 [Burkholderia mallei SAVP1]
MRAAQVSTRRAKRGQCRNNRPERPDDFCQAFDLNDFFAAPGAPPADRRPAARP